MSFNLPSDSSVCHTCLYVAFATSSRCFGIFMLLDSVRSLKSSGVLDPDPRKNGLALPWPTKESGTAVFQATPHSDTTPYRSNGCITPAWRHRRRKPSQGCL